MRIIAHRGNINGPNPELENNPTHILNALNMGFDVEVDVWVENDKLYFGHDKPQYKVENIFLKSKNFWYHAKNKEALEYLTNTDLNYFWHEKDQYTLTSKCIAWCYPGFYHKTGIAVLNNNILDINKMVCFGICTDYALFYSKQLKRSK